MPEQFTFDFTKETPEEEKRSTQETPEEEMARLIKEYTEKISVPPFGLNRETLVSCIEAPDKEITRLREEAQKENEAEGRRLGLHY